MTASDFLSRAVETNFAISGLILAILIIRKPVAQKFGAEAAHLLWLAPLLRFVMPELRILPASPAAPSVTHGEPLVTPSFEVADFSNVMAHYSGAATAGGHGLNMALILSSVWIMGAFVFLLLQFRAQHRFELHLSQEAFAPSPALIAEAGRIARDCGLTRTPRLYLTENFGPLASGALKPAVYLPKAFESSFTPEERRLALMHEFTHIARGDLIASFLALLFRAANWPNPLAHIAVRAFRTDMEAACDASVLRRCGAVPEISFAYGAALLKAARNCASAPANALSMSSFLKERLMLMKSPPRTNALAARLTAALLIAGGLALTANYAEAREAKDDAKVAVKEKKKKTSTSITIITVDKGETMTIKGFKDPGKFYLKNENGVRTIKIWNRKDVLVSENTYAAGEKLPFEEIVVKKKDGKTKVIHLNKEPGHPDVAYFDKDFDWNDDFPPPPGHNGDGHDEHIVIMGAGDDIPHPPAFSFANGCNDDASNVIVDLGDDIGEHHVHKQVICLDGDDAKDPKARAETLKKAIARMEERKARTAEAQQAAINRLKEELAKAEKDAK
ncbi:MAG: M56 family metallopeptidase [Parvularculaceae bacterium]